MLPVMLYVGVWRLDSMSRLLLNLRSEHMGSLKAPPLQSKNQFFRHVIFPMTTTGATRLPERRTRICVTPVALQVVAIRLKNLESIHPMQQKTL